MTIDDLTVGQLKQLTGLLQAGKLAENPYEIGAAYFIRTVTFHYTGRLVRVTEHELVLEDAAWIADNGRFSDALAKGTLNEVEPYPVGHVIIGRGSLVDAVFWPHALPRVQK